MFPSCARELLKPPLWALPISRDWQSVSGKTKRKSRSNGRSIAGSFPPSNLSGENSSAPAGPRLWRAPKPGNSQRPPARSDGWLKPVLPFCPTKLPNNRIGSRLFPAHEPSPLPPFRLRQAYGRQVGHPLPLGEGWGEGGRSQLAGPNEHSSSTLRRRPFGADESFIRGGPRAGQFPSPERRCGPSILAGEHGLVPSLQRRRNPWRNRLERLRNQGGADEVQHPDRQQTEARAQRAVARPALSGRPPSAHRFPRRRDQSTTRNQGQRVNAMGRGQLRRCGSPGGDLVESRPHLSGSHTRPHDLDETKNRTRKTGVESSRRWLV